ncbi:DNA-binding transcriptional LysR family regulator [Sphingobium sp. B1D7B]|uniref:LysR family transcriptional regulator n=1 Tax=unclassified Sphingobium TaxID=2611147 RepID=UPI0022250C49|nr:MULTISPECIES: LysR family transcriptional regulator [unclassified Sphingobium]MCW2392421.1 DNA-binding transcriptional LysR family regulator [Sphingobium sp. B11D3A]MCW2404116.1 DNA-binding transcriptional LysR family regulator [Sphingobium sp. B1D7B]
MSNNIDWDHQRAFLAVFEEGSLSGAARRLGVAQPTVRARIAALEQTLRTVLFTRSVNGLAPTEEARALADAARAMARASEAFVRTASAPPGEVAGVVRLSVSEFVGIEVLPPMIASLRQKHPRIAIELSLSNVSADLLEQEVDIAVRMHPPRQGALVAKKAGSIALALFAHNGYLARRGIPQSLEDLDKHDFIGPDRSGPDLQFAATLFPAFRRDYFAARTDSHPAQLALARAGLGIAVVQRPVGLADPRLSQVLPNLEIGMLDTWIVTHEDLRDVPRIRAVFDHLALAFTSFARSA